MMNKKIEFEKPDDFLKFNYKRLKEEYFEHYHINTLFDSLKNEEGILYDLYNIVGDDGTDILAVWAGISYYLYAKKWNEESLQILESSIDIENYEIIILRGQKDLVNEIINRKNLTTRLINDRIIFDCEEINENISDVGNLVLGSEYNFEDILSLNLGYYHEDFKGKGSQSDEQIEYSVRIGILEEKIYTWEVNKKLTSALRIINNDSENVMIGALFTNAESRKKGFASDLLKSATSKILKNGAKKCGLLTERDNLGSNKAVKSANYKKKYEWINVQIIE